MTLLRGPWGRFVCCVLLGAVVGLTLPLELLGPVALAVTGWCAWQLRLRWDDRRKLAQATRLALDAAEEATDAARTASAVLRGDAPPPFECPLCGTKSWHPKDAEQGYCGKCHWWTGDPVLGQVTPPYAPRPRRASR